MGHKLSDYRLDLDQHDCDMGSPKWELSQVGNREPLRGATSDHRRFEQMPDKPLASGHSKDLRIRQVVVLSLFAFELK